MTDLNSGDALSEWPVDGLEQIGYCPICGDKRRQVLHDELTDRIFNCAPGSWTLHSCQSCSAAYLDPRPSTESIGIAYENYFTHNDAPEYQALGNFAKVRRQLANGYRNRKYGTRDFPARSIGALAVPAFSGLRAIVDAGMRHIPRPTEGSRLLDLGCGNGAFLLRARSAGWQVLGVDFDPKAVQAAQNLDLDVRLGGVEILDVSTERFNVITMSHVIEHVHDPVGTLKSCFDLLRPGGVLWLDTPNIRSYGHETFGRNWRGLEPPRHLVIFSPASMRDALDAAGFSTIETQPYRHLCREIFAASNAISKGVDPYSSDRPSVSAALIRNAESVARRDSERREFITLKAWK